MSEDEARTAVKKMAERWLHQYQENEKNHVTDSYIYSISHIDGVSVTASWRLFPTTENRATPMLKINFDSRTKLTDDCSQEQLWCGMASGKPITEYKDEIVAGGATVEMMADMIESILVRIKKLNYDRLRGLTERQFKTAADIEMIVFNMPNVKHDGVEVCCVCHELTRHETECGHHLCWQCWAKLEVHVNEENEHDYQVCPICRDDMELYG